MAQVGVEVLESFLDDGLDEECEQIEQAYLRIDVEGQDRL